MAAHQRPWRRERRAPRTWATLRHPPAPRRVPHSAPSWARSCSSYSIQTGVRQGDAGWRAREHAGGVVCGSVGRTGHLPHGPRGVDAAGPSTPLGVDNVAWYPLWRWLLRRSRPRGSRRRCPTQGSLTLEPGRWVLSTAICDAHRRPRQLVVRPWPVRVRHHLERACQASFSGWVLPFHVTGRSYLLAVGCHASCGYLCRGLVPLWCLRGVALHRPQRCVLPAPDCAAIPQ